jgi:LemA protein
VQTFPGNIFAGIFGFKKEAMYEIEASQRAAVEKAPEIKF